MWEQERPINMKIAVATVTLIAVAVMAVCAGCGSSGPWTSGLPPADGSSRDTSGAIPTLGATAFDTRSGLPDTTHVSAEHRIGCLFGDPWTVLGISSNGRELLLHTSGASGVQVRYAGSAVIETAGSVEIGIYRIWLEHNDGAGISAVNPFPVIVHLARPLSTRILLHAPLTESC